MIDIQFNKKSEYQRLMLTYQKIHRGFTLIELLVVIAIIDILSSIVLVSLNTARAKARDVRKQADFRQISTALVFYYDKYGSMPPNYVSGCYYNYGKNNSIGALIVTTLEAAPSNTTGILPSCRLAKF